MSQKPRKTKVIQMEAQAIRQHIEKEQQKLREIEVNQATAQVEEQLLLESVQQQIEQLCQDNGLFCGVILSTQDILNLVDLAIKTNEVIPIPFRLYFKE